MHRPVYMIRQSEEKKVYRITTVISEFFSVPDTHPMKTYINLFTYPLQVLRFHIFNI